MSWGRTRTRSQKNRSRKVIKNKYCVHQFNDTDSVVIFVLTSNYQQSYTVTYRTRDATKSPKRIV